MGGGGGVSSPICTNQWNGGGQKRFIRLKTAVNQVTDSCEGNFGGVCRTDSVSKKLMKASDSDWGHKSVINQHQIRVWSNQFYLIGVSTGGIPWIGSQSGHFQKSCGPAPQSWSTVRQSSLLAFIRREIQYRCDNPQHLQSFSIGRREIADHKILDQGPNALEIKTIRQVTERWFTCNQNRFFLFLFIFCVLPVHFTLRPGLQLSDLVAAASQFFFLRVHCQ